MANGIFGYLRRVAVGRFSAVWWALAALFLVSALIPNGLTTVSVYSMLPFAAILAIAAVGQTLVIQQRGIDFSVVGNVTLAAVIVSRFSDGSSVAGAIGLALLVGAVAGLLNGLAVTRLGITPLIATLGVNALLLGATHQVSGGSVASVPQGMNDFFVARPLGVPATVWFGVVFVGALAVVLKRSAFGRRLEAVGSNPASAEAAGIPVARHLILVYVIGGLCYAIAGIVLAGYVRTPGLNAGDAYLLASVAAVVIGGTALAGGRASIIATSAAALLLSQVDQLVLAVGAPPSVQLLVQSAAIAISVGVRRIKPSRRRRTMPVPARALTT